jgi:hypothetical protein
MAGEFVHTFSKRLSCHLTEIADWGEAAGVEAGAWESLDNLRAIPDDHVAVFVGVGLAELVVGDLVARADDEQVSVGAASEHVAFRIDYRLIERIFGRLCAGGGVRVGPRLRCEAVVAAKSHSLTLRASSRADGSVRSGAVGRGWGRKGVVLPCGLIALLARSRGALGDPQPSRR